MNKDIVGAMAKEREYLSFRMKGEEPYHFVDAVKEFGFEGIEEFFDAKRDYLFNQISFNFVEQPMPGGVDEIFKMINTNRAGVLFVDWEDTFVVCADRGLEEFNKQYCEENDIAFFPLYTGGGTIVGSKGDFSFGVCSPKNIISEPAFILNQVKSILQKHTTKEITVKGNDICADGNKICGSANYVKGNVLMVIMHFSFSDLSALIANICTTAKVGKTVAYVDFMTREEFKKEVAEWLRVSYT